MLKIHRPTQAVNPGEPKFRAFYRKCAEQEMRVMVHTGAEHSAPIASKTLGDPRLLQLALASAGSLRLHCLRMELNATIS